MKIKTFVLIALLPISSSVYSQQSLVGTTTGGGGSVFSISSRDSGYDLQRLNDLSKVKTFSVRQGLIEANGSLWGMANLGGAFDLGAIYRLETDGSGYSKVHDFDGVDDGSRPVTGLIEFEGKLWGATSMGGANGNGTLFTIELDGTHFTKVLDFDLEGLEGVASNPELAIINDQLWGNMYGAGLFFGAIFKVNLSEIPEVEIVHQFDGDDGENPNGIILHEGKIWGTTEEGGAYNGGVLFSMNIDGTEFTKVVEDPSDPIFKSKLVVVDDKFWGVGKNGRAEIFSINTDGTGYTVEYTCERNEGVNPSGNLTRIGSKFYGTTGSGGSSDRGILYSYDTELGTFEIQHDFVDSEAQRPIGGVMQLEDTFIGLSWNGSGYIYTIDLADYNYSTLYNLFDRNTFVQLSSGLIFHEGRYLGLTSYEDSFYSTIYSVGQDGAGFEILFDLGYDEETFSYDRGVISYGSLFEDADGKIWGMTLYGGTSFVGVIFYLDYEDGVYTYHKVHDFDGLGGSLSYGSLIEYDEKLWGMTSGGGSTGDGVVFYLEQTADGYIYQKVHDFDNVNGSAPYGSLVEHDGKLWGMTSEGGSTGEGVIFSLSLGVDIVFNKEIDLENAGGITPYGSLVSYEDKLWGMTSEGGSSGDGVIFSVTPGETVNYAKVHDFDGDSGSEPKADLTVFEGELFGMTNAGGVFDTGVVFKFNLTSGTFEVVSDFTTELGAYSEYSSLSVVGEPCELLSSSFEVTVFDQYVWDGTIYNMSGSYTNNYVTELGCDSTATLNLTILEVPNEYEVEENVSALIIDLSEVSGATFSLGITKDEAFFTVGEAGVSFADEPDYELPQDADENNEYLIDLVATDEAGNVSSMEVAITVADVDEIAPEVTSASEVNIDENSTGSIYRITSDEEATFSLGSEMDEGLFALDGADISFISAPDFEEPLDADENNVYLVNVIATDTNGNVGSLTVSITVTDVDELAPEITSDRVIFVEENTSGDFYKIVADEEATFTLGTEKDEAWFRLEEGVLAFVDAPDFEVPFGDNEDNDYFIDIVAVDAAENVSTTQLVVSIIDVDESVVLGVDEPFGAVTFYPNPIREQLFFNTQRELHIRIMSLEGRLLVNEQVSGSVDLSKLKQGSYLLELTDGDRKTIQRIIKIN